MDLFCSPLTLHYLCTQYEETEYIGDEPHQCGGVQGGGEVATGCSVGRGAEPAQCRFGVP